MDKAAFRVTSIKTRIETLSLCQSQRRLHFLLESLPLKQGLKPGSRPVAHQTADLLESLPLKQGLKLKSLGTDAAGVISF